MKTLSTLAAAALIAAAFLFSSCTPTYEAPEATTEVPKPVIDPEAAFAATYFCGDSNTAHLAHSAYTAIRGLVPSAHIWTGGGDTLMLDLGMHIIDPETEESISVEDAAEKYRPEYLIITLGYNGYAQNGGEKLSSLFRRAYEKLIDSVKTASPSTKIIAQSIFPVRAGTAVKDPTRVNSRIDELNLILRELASEKGIKYLDTASILKDEGGTLRAEYSCEGSFFHADGYHLSDTGLRAVINHIIYNAYGD